MSDTPSECEKCLTEFARRHLMDAAGREAVTAHGREAARAAIDVEMADYHQRNHV